jgi:N-6 DNA Methylase
MIFRQQVTGSLLSPEGSSSSLTWSVRSELRYLEWAIDHLAPGSRCTLIVPDGILFRKDRIYRHVRERLLTECVVRAVVRLPIGIFSDAKGIRVSLLVFEGGTTRQGVIRYYEVPSLTREQISRRILPADVLDGAIAADAPFDAEHLLRFLKSKPGRLEVSRLSRGSVRRRLRYEDLRQIAVPYADRAYAEPLPAGK